jgi:hypothetical protein
LDGSRKASKRSKGDLGIDIGVANNNSESVGRRESTLKGSIQAPEDQLEIENNTRVRILTLIIYDRLTFY